MALVLMNGLRVSSEGMPTGLPALREQTELPDVIVRRGAVPPGGAEVPGPTPLFEQRGEAVWMRLKRKVRILVEGGRRVTFEAESGCGDARALRKALQLAFAPLLLQRCGAALHASAVAFPTGAAVFTAPSGTGKSTLAAAFSARGCGFLADDSCILDGVDGRLRVLSSGRYLRLRHDAVRKLSLASNQTTDRRSVAPVGKQRLPASPVAAASRPELRAIFLLQRGRPEGALVRPTAPEQAWPALRKQLWRPTVAPLFEAGDVRVSACARLAAIPMYTVTLPDQWGRYDSLLEQISALVCER